MSEGLKEEQSFWDKLKKSYRLVVFNYETFQELYTYKLTLLNIYILISSFVVVITLLILSLFFFTPLKEMIPGYGDIERNTRFIQMEQDIGDLEIALAAQEQYNLKLQELLNSDGSNAEPYENVEDSSDSEDQQAIAESNSEKQTKKSETTELPEFIAPLKGQVSAKFNEEENHFGIDVIAASNTPIKTISEGKVIFSGWTLETGNTIGIQHSSNIVSFYKHNSSLLREVGDYVNAGEAIAIIGNTGELSSGPHLHFELWINGKVKDPASYITFN